MSQFLAYLWSVASTVGIPAIVASAMVYFLRNYIGERIRCEVQIEYDKKLEAFKAELQKDLEVFKEGLAKVRRVDEKKHEVLSHTISLLCSLLAIIQNIVTETLNMRSPQSYWDPYYSSLRDIANDYIQYKALYFENHTKNFEQLEQAANEITHELETAQKCNRPYQINFSILTQVINNIQRDLVSDMNGK